MPKAKYNNRLEELFSNIDAVNPEPAPGECPEQAGGSNGVEKAGDIPGTLPVETHRVRSDDGGSAETTLADAFNDASGEQFRVIPDGWGEFLDGIRRQEQIGYTFDRSEIKELGSSTDAAQETAGQPEVDEAPITAPIQVSGEEIGKLMLETDPDREWTVEDKELVEAVAQQLAQQIETLRLLDEAQRSRGEAEHAYHRLARQSMAEDETVDLNPAAPAAGWTDQQAALSFEVKQADAEVDGTEKTNGKSPAVLNAPIRLGESTLGELQVAGEQPLNLDDVDLVETVAQRLAQQVENLRLLEESRHFRSETEDAIRRLTYQNWQAYLAASSKANLGFQYNRSRVLPMTPAEDLDGKVFPLKVHDEVIGQLSVDTDAARRKDVADLVDIIGDRLGVHLDGLRLAEQREQALAESETLYNITSQLSTSQSLEDALSSVSEPAREAGARDSRLFFVSLDDRGLPEGLTLAAVWYPEGGAQVAPVSAHFMLADYPDYAFILQDPYRPLLISNVLTDPDLKPGTRDLLVKTGATAVAVLPLAINGRWVGAIFINWDQPHAFTRQEDRLFSSLARQAAVVVNNRLLLEQTRKRAQELQTVAQVSTAASTILDPQELLQTVVDLTRSSFSLYHAQIYLLREEENVLEVAAGAGEIGRQAAEQKMWVLLEGSSATARAAKERQVVIANDVQNEPGYKPNPLLPDVRSEMALPMIAGDRLLGVFNVQANTTNRFSRDEARTYTTLASQVAVAMQNAALYAEQAATVQRLRELDHLKSAFLANMSHELRTPLNSILGFAEVLLLELDGPLNETMTNDIRLIEKNGKHLLSLINDVLDMAKIEAGKMNLAPEKFVLRDVMEETLDITSSLAREKSLYLVIDPESQDHMDLVADRVRVRQVLINVVANAVKFTEKGGITICAVQFPEERKVQIRINDTGIGIPPDKLENIFESFSQVDTSTTRKAGGTGLGLPISRRLVEMHGGHLWAESTGVAGEGSHFIIELPFEAVKH